ncbi:MAG: uncharacterized protein KVP18_000660 [Porospora cf. gigantea A]|uniref:uncharacterized protein n=1 Tax=Porospora cf. gigantea A TaxID=2853593 RepID=UPI0035597F56|nr:MAG: hypothetical protein KVP18_000660 [Porospora cf. gigantea A]
MKEELKPYDYEDLGYPTDAERELPKAEVRRIICERKEAKWIDLMQRKGVPLHSCQTCRRTVTDRHRCFNTGLRIPHRTDTPYQKTELIAQAGPRGSVKMQLQTVIDPHALLREAQRVQGFLDDGHQYEPNAQGESHLCQTDLRVHPERR